MLKYRVIPVLLLENGRLIKTRQFQFYKDTGDPMNTVRIFDAQDADELIFLDISATVEGRDQYLELINKSARECFIPLTVGGGIKSTKDAVQVFKNGADRACICSAALKNPNLIDEMAKEFGQANIVVCIDAKKDKTGQYKAAFDRATHLSDKDPVSWAGEASQRGAGEIMLHFTDRDGMMADGYDIELLKKVTDKIKTPVIACGGVGGLEHFSDGILKGGARAVAAASIFHFTDQSPIRVHNYLHGKSIPVCVT